MLSTTGLLSTGTRRLFAVALMVLSCTVVQAHGGHEVQATDSASPGAVLEEVPSQPLPFVVDVWTNKGGQGTGEYGGDFAVDEELIVYFKATLDCVASIMVAPLDGPPSALMDAQLAAGETYQIVPSEAGADLTGAWEVVVSAVSGQTQSSDSVVFTVGDVSIALTPGVIVALSPDQATELDALVAVKMATGAMAPDLSLDVDRDGQVTMDDARLILIWAVQ